jgi:hypothetical protein
MAIVRLLALSTLGVALGSIYPVDHWQHSTKLTTDNFEEQVKLQVDSGKTFFVRWIASEG